MTVEQILNSLRAESSSKAKAKILTENKANAELEKIFKYAYDKVSFVYGVSKTTVEAYETDKKTESSLDEVLNDLSARKVSGHKALELSKAFINSNPELKDLFLSILDRDLKVGINSKTLNKIWKGIIRN